MDEIEIRTSRLLATLEQRVGERVPAERPRLTIRLTPKRAEPQPTPRRLSDVDREMHARMIHHYRRRYAYLGMQVLVDQALSEAGVAMVYDLDDDALLRLRKDVDRARQCSEEGIPWEDAGLLRSVG